MKNNFDKHIIEWFHEYLENHKENNDLLLSLINILVVKLDDESVDDILDGQTPIEYLMDYDDTEQIYEKLFHHAESDCLKDIPDSDKFISTMLKKSVKELGLDKYDFTDEFIDDMAYHICDYSNPLGFFQDLSHGGCISGMIGMLIYHSDCLELYGKYAVSMEEYKEDMEEELGEPIRQKSDNSTYHYTWMCWLCYEELAYSIARYLYEDEF